MNDSEALGVNERLASAGESIERGDLDAAREILEGVLSETPGHAKPHAMLAQIAAKERNRKAMHQHMKDAADFGPSEPQYQANYGLVALQEGLLAEAVRYLERACELDPKTGAYMLYLGVAQLYSRDQNAAERTFARLLFIEPELLTHRNVQAPHPKISQYIAVARQVMQQSYGRVLGGVLAKTRSAYPEADVTRLQEAFEALLGIRQYARLADKQEPEVLRYPGLRQQPFYERDEFPWLRDIEASTSDIVREWRELRGFGEEILSPYLEADSRPSLKEGYEADLVGSRRWGSFHLYRLGRIDENCARCPIAAEMVDALPLAQADNYMPEVFFSELSPGAHIPPHHGLSNIRLAVHLPLEIPEQCAIRVGEETRSWEYGQCLIFDDSFEHEAWNRSDEPRSVLIFEIWHPDLTPGEIYGLQELFRARAQFIQSGEFTTSDAS